jgi:hypothetical protein
MREFHVVFMYYALPLLWRFPEHLTDAHDLVDAEDEDDLIQRHPTGGEALITALKALLRGLHLTKGFTSEVTYKTTCIFVQQFEAKSYICEYVPAYNAFLFFIRNTE